MQSESDISPRPISDLAENGLNAAAAFQATGPAAALVRVPVAVQIMLGSAKMPLAELLSLRQGSMFSLEQKLGEPVTVIVNGCKVASGELFVLKGDKLGVKIKDILSGAAT